MSENQNIEWKKSWHDDYLKGICGFANTVGGTLYIGKDNSGKTVHLNDYQSLLESIPSKIKHSMGILCDIQLLEDISNKYIEIKVHPYTVPVSLRGRYYYRTGSTTMELTGTELNEFLLKKAGKTWDDVLEEGALIDDIDEKTLANLINDSKEQQRIPDTIDLSTIQILEKLRLAENNKIKRGAIILFGKDPSRFYPNVQVKIGRFGKDGSDLKFQEIVEGNLIYLLREVQVLLNYKFLTRPIDFEGMHRIEKGEYPVAALREMLLNALVHRSYMGAPIQIRVYDDKLSIWNEGTLPQGLSIENLKNNHNSRPRNPKIADTCFKAGYIDAWGRGTLKIFNSCKEAELAEPIILEKDGGVEVTIFNGNQGSNQVGNQGGNQVGGEKVSKDYSVLLKWINKNMVDAKYKPTEKSLAKYEKEASLLNELHVKILDYCQRPRKRKEILEECLKISNQTKNFKTHIQPLLEKDLLQLTIKDKPQSQFQQYHITTKAKIILYMISDKSSK